MNRPKKRRLKKRYWLLIDVAILFVFFILLTHKPGRYSSIGIGYPEDNESSGYLADELKPGLRKGLRVGRPFDLVITQEGINEILVSSEWPRESEGTNFSEPKVFFESNRILLMGTAKVKDTKFIVTIAVIPTFNEEGFLNLEMEKMKVGALNLTLIARMMAKKMYTKKAAQTQLDTESLQAKIIASLLTGKPFDPVFEFEGKNIRAEEIFIEQEKMTVRLAPL